MSSHQKTNSPWLPRASCDESCIAVGASIGSRRMVVMLRTAIRIACAIMVLPAAALLAVPMPGK
jgi:hypothetical protein